MTDDAGTVGDLPSTGRASGAEMDIKRKEQIAYQYLCRLEEAKQWMEACLKDELPPTTELEEALRTGVMLAKLSNFFAPEVVPQKRIYDIDGARFELKGLHFKHTDNINYWMAAMSSIGMPSIFFPTTTDIYDRKNMPKCIYCIHALSIYLYKLGKAPQIQDLHGIAEFTEEEISAMQRELEKYGIQMPAFGKIGGLLASELSVDEAAVHAAILAINEAVDKGVPAETLAALNNPAAGILGIESGNADHYQDHLAVTKAGKAARVSPSGEAESKDVYDYLLTKTEIQRSLSAVNDAVKEEIAKARFDAAISAINDAVDQRDLNTLMAALSSSHASLEQVEPLNAEYYMDGLVARKAEKSAAAGDHVSLSQEDIQSGLLMFNVVAQEARDLGAAISAINDAIDQRDLDALMEALLSPHARLEQVEQLNAEYYMDGLAARKAEKSATAGDHVSLSQEDVQSGLLVFNALAQEDRELAAAVAFINATIDKNDSSSLLTALKLPGARLTDVRDEQQVHYMAVLEVLKRNKKEIFDDEDAELDQPEIQDGLNRANGHAEDTLQLASTISAINVAIDAGDAAATLAALGAKSVKIKNITEECADLYQERLKAAKDAKQEKAGATSGWSEYQTREGHSFYHNSSTGESAWVKPEGYDGTTADLSQDEIQSIVSMASADFDRETLLKSKEPLIVQLQARVRGVLLRRKFKDRLRFLKSQEATVVKLQANWKGLKQRREFRERKTHFVDNTAAIIKIQAYVRGWLARRQYQRRLKYMNDNVAAVVKIQSWFRGYHGRKLYKKLMGADKPPVETVSRFLHLLEQSDVDFTEELELQKLKAQVVTEIRGNQQLESDLNVMDIKIGLLVRNRLELQDVVNHGRRLKRRRGDVSQMSLHGKGLKTLDKESRQRLEAYQHLFYLLQTNPSYFAKLIFEMPQSKTTKFMENVILTVFNFASNQREEYLMLKLFETALKEEVASKVDELKEIITGNPTVIKMVVHFNRGARGQSQLRDLLEPLVSDIIGDRSLVIHTSPVDVYKAWINQMEQETGQPSKLPYEVSNDQALSHVEVRERMADTIRSLKEVVTRFLNSILQSVSKIPYGMRYVAMQLRLALIEKFPDAAEDEILKVVGNLIYYRYMNPAIVAPDAFDIVSLTADKGLNPDQRRNLGSIAKVLQYAAANKMFEGENAALVAVNPYIQEAFVKFRSFFLRASTVEDAETHFSIDEYTDVVTLTKPTIYISVKEIISTHSLLLEHEEAVAPEPDDPIHEVLRDLGEVPDAQTLLGGEAVYPEPGPGGRPLTEEQIRANQGKLEEQGKTEISLTLTSKFERFEDDDTDMKALFVRTKRLVVDVLRTQTGDNLSAILYTPASDEQEDEHQRHIKKRHTREDEASEKGTGVKRSQSLHGDDLLPLEGMKRKIQRNLRLLESDGLVSSTNNYQELINAIARDIRNQHRYRQQRKRELARLYQTIAHLNEKAKFFEDQINYYQQYIKMCLANLAKAKGKASGRLYSKQQSDAQQAVRKSIRYSGQKLYDKGVIQDIEGLPPHQLRNVSFEITATEVGVFDVSAKFMGVSMEKVELIFQDLLQLQYEGVTVMKMFGKAKINVNLLIFLINKKFYGK